MYNTTARMRYVSQIVKHVFAGAASADACASYIEETIFACSHFI